MSNEMEMEDFLRGKDAEIAALNEQIDNLVARIRVYEEREQNIAKFKEERDRLLAALDDALSVIRGRADIARQEQEAGL